MAYLKLPFLQNWKSAKLEPYHTASQGLLILQTLEINKTRTFDAASSELLFLWTTILLMRVSNSHFVNSHLVNVYKVGIDKVGSPETFPSSPITIY